MSQSMTVSVTERGTWRRCHRKWHLTSLNRERISPVASVSKALDLGTLVHKTIADWILDPKADPVHIFLGHASARMKQINEQYIKIVGIKPSDDEVEPFLEAVELGQKMMENYKLRWKTPLPANMTFASPEQAVEIQIPGTDRSCLRCVGTGKTRVDVTTHESSDREYIPAECTECGGTGKVWHYLKGTLDGLVQDTKDRVYILEHKTYARRPRRDTLDMNDQFLAYIWVLTKLNIAPVGGLAYDGMWKKPSPPRRGTLEDLFLRDVLTRSQAELDEFEHFLAREVQEMYEAPYDLMAPELYMNRRWEGCSDCTVRLLCNTISRGEDVDWVLKNHYTKRVEEEALGVAPTEEPTDDEDAA